jgi:hypothetical protein
MTFIFVDSPPAIAHDAQTDNNRGDGKMFLTYNKRLLNKDDLAPESIEFLREQIAGETLKKAAPQLLEALESLFGSHTMAENYDVKIYATKEQIAKAKAAIAAAKGS